MDEDHRWTGPGDDAGAAWSLLEEFAAVVSHELRTPLSVVKAAVSTLLDQRDELSEDQMRQLLEMIARNADLTVLLLDRIGLAREVDRGDVRLSREPVDLCRLVRESVSDLRAAVLGEHPAMMTGPDALVLDADPTALREIVFNLLSNAAKYSAVRAQIEIAVEARDTLAVVVVRNHGSGVAPPDVDRIFGKFERIEGQGPGTGLGLFISRGLARAHGGDLTVRPAADVGSEFVLTLPRPSAVTSG